MAKAVKTKVKVPAFKSSGYAALDVTTGRKGLAKHLEKVGLVRATLDVVIRYPSSHDDGISIEFCCDVEQIKNIRSA